jgi:hypothetical protein
MYIRVARQFISIPKILIWEQFGGPWNGKSWCILQTFGLSFSILVHIPTVWYILLYFGILSFILVYCPPFWYIIIHFDIFTYILVYFPHFGTYIVPRTIWQPGSTLSTTSITGPSDFVTTQKVIETGLCRSNLHRLQTYFWAPCCKLHEDPYFMLICSKF